MKRKIEKELNEMIRLTNEKPGTYTLRELSHETGLALSTVGQHANRLNLPVKKKTEYTKDQREFVRTHADVMTLTEVAAALGLKAWQVQYMAEMDDVRFMVRYKNQKEETGFFEHDKFYMF